MACSITCATSVRAQTPAAVEVAVRVIPTEVRINGADGGLWPVLERGGSYYAPDEAFTAWRLQRSPAAPSMDYRGLRYTSLSSLPGADVKLDATLNVLNVNVGAEAFAGTRLTRQQDQVLARDETVPGLFLNYDISADYASPRQGAATSALGMTGELGYSTDWGVLTHSFVARDLAGTQDDQRKVTRLNTTLRRDYPERRLTLSVGDGTTRTSYLGRPSYFGGVQLGTNFGLTPGFNRNPIPVVSGETRAPSTVQLYVNNVLRQTTNVPSGPFTLDNIPAVSGTGDVSVVVRDILGRETVITQPFFVTSDLLAPGISDWSAEAGRLRLNLGADSSDYGDAFVAGMWRRGLSRSLTLEGRAERTPELTTLGAAAVVSLGGKYVARAGLAGSRDAVLGSGHRWLAGLDWQDDDRSFILAVEGNSRNFLGLGDLRNSISTRLQLSGQAGLQLGRYGRLNASFVTQQPHDGDRVTALSVSHYVELRERWLLASSYSRTFGTVNTGSNVSVSLNIPLGKRMSSNASAQFKPGRVDVNASVVRSPDGPYGTAWRVLTSQQENLRAEVGAYHFGTGGIVSGEVSASRDQTNLRAGLTGSLLYAGGKLAMLQRFDNSAALVEVPGYAGIGVGLGGRPSTTTDAQGRAFITGLSAYQSNPIQLAANDLPITAEIDNIEKATVPAARSVTRVTFQVRGGRGAMVRVVLDDGQPAPVGSVIRLQGEDRDFLLSRRGEAYVTGLKDTNTLVLTWKGKACPLTVTLPPGSVDEIARVGPISCTGVER